MMLHFLIQFKVYYKNDENSNNVPLLPNLQWIIENNNNNNNNNNQRKNAHYRILKSKPTSNQYLMKHPTVSDYTVNIYFYKPKDNNALRTLQQYYTGNNRTNVGILLASFFRYYAYEFDYKKFVVSSNYTLNDNTRSNSCKIDK